MHIVVPEVTDVVVSMHRRDNRQGVTQNNRCRLVLVALDVVLVASDVVDETAG